MLSTSRERDGYDGIRNGVKWWFERWGSGRKHQWASRDSHGRPPSPAELAAAEYIVFGFEYPNGRTDYKTRVGGLDL